MKIIIICGVWLRVTYTGLALGEKTAITSLGLRRSGLGSEGLCEMCRAVGMNITVTSLDLSLNTFDNQSTASLGKFL